MAGDLIGLSGARGHRGTRRACHCLLRPTRYCVRIFGGPGTYRARASLSSWKINPT